MYKLFIKKDSIRLSQREEKSKKNIYSYFNAC